MANTYLSRTPSSASNRRTWTWSAWVKRNGTYAGGAEQYQYLWDADNGASQSESKIGFISDTLHYNIWNGSSNDAEVITNAKYRDTNAWYHIVIAFDTTQATASDRIKFYVNGVQETSFSTTQYPSQNYEGGINNNCPHSIGRWTDGNGRYFDGIMSHVHFCDGQTYQASDFGEYDANGVWKIKTSPSVTYGTNGFFILKDGNSVTDQSGNSNNFTVGGGTLTNTEDNPSNVFATLNPLDKGYTGTIVLANGNTTTMNSTGAGDYGLRSTIGVNSGKYYWEVKTIDSDAFAILPMEAALKFDMFGSTPEPDLYGIQRSTDTLTNFFDDTSFISGNTAWGGITSSDVTGFALDMDNGKLFLSKNGVFKNISGTSSDPVAGTNPTFTISDTSKTYGFYIELRTNANNGIKVNFGNGYFGTTAVASAGTNASGIGIFEYDVPTGYTALSTKGLNL